MSIHPVVFTWMDVDVTVEHGEVRRCKAMVPLQRYGNLCGRQFADGEEYPLTLVEQRSMASHNAFFAQVEEAYDNLPETIAARWDSADHMRKWILIETGWHHELEYPAPTELHAKRLMTFIRTEDDYVRAFRRGDLIIIRRARSQSKAAMPQKDEFEASKRAVLNYLEALTGIPVSILKKEAGRHG